MSCNWGKQRLHKTNQNLQPLGALGHMLHKTAQCNLLHDTVWQKYNTYTSKSDKTSNQDFTDRRKLLPSQAFQQELERTWLPYFVPQVIHPWVCDFDLIEELTKPQINYMQTAHFNLFIKTQKHTNIKTDNYTKADRHQDKKKDAKVHIH